MLILLLSLLPVPPVRAAPPQPAGDASACPGSVEGLPADPRLDPADARLQDPALIVVLKERRRLALYRDGALVPEACWPVGLGFGDPQGPKRIRGDRKTPEGWYRTQDKPWSKFYAALAVSYPNAQDARWGLDHGRVDAATSQGLVQADRAGRMPDQGTALGGQILIHGGGGSSDWTLGCIALDDADIDALRAALPAGLKTDLLILP